MPGGVAGDRSVILAAPMPIRNQAEVKNSLVGRPNIEQTSTWQFMMLFLRISGRGILQFDQFKQ